jgi:hypothetical protein
MQVALQEGDFLVVAVEVLPGAAEGAAEQRTAEVIGEPECDFWSEGDELAELMNVAALNSRQDDDRFPADILNQTVEVRLQVAVVMKQAVDQERESRIVLGCSCGLKVQCFLREALLPDEAFFFGFLEGGAHVSRTFVTHQGVEGGLDQFVLLVFSGLEGGHRAPGRIQMQQGVMVVEGSNQGRNSFRGCGKRKDVRCGRSIPLQGPFPAEDVAVFQREQGGLCGDEEAV